jgi:hypothetical protein
LTVLWVDSDDLEPGAGHGVDFFAGEPSSSDAVLIAVLRGFDWLHGDPDTVEIAIRRPDVHFDVSFLSEARASIEQYVANPSILRSGSQPSKNLWAHING